MSTRTFVIVDGDDAPAAFRAGGGKEYGHIEMDTIQLAYNLASQAFMRDDELAAHPDDLATLRASVNKLSDALSAVTGQLMQLEAGIRHGRIAVTDRD